MLMTGVKHLTNQQKIRFICSNHKLYDSAEKVGLIMCELGILPCDFDIAQESWWESVEWWKDDLFLQALGSVNVALDKTITIKVNSADSLKYYVSSKK